MHLSSIVKKSPNNDSLSLYHYVKSGALRWLHSLDLREWSITYGIADREFWAWKTKDFANGTWQAGIAGFLDAKELLSISDEQIQKIVRCCLQGTYKIQRSNGSFEEAYPYESSYAVTGLVLFNWMYVRLKYPEYFNPELDEVLNRIVTNCQKFLKSTPETHGLISNHVATTELALALANKWKGLKSPKLQVFQHQNSEGWFMEYQGADPGYETLLQSYFAAANLVGLDLNEHLDKLGKSRSFTRHFALPNGSYSGEVGARGTSIFYPASLLLAPQKVDLDWFLKSHVGFSGSVNPITVDAGNFVPVFNSWALFQHASEQVYNQAGNEDLPAAQDFPLAGLFVRRNKSDTVIVSSNNCNWRHVKSDGGSWKDLSVAAIYFNKRHFTSAKVQECTIQKIALSPLEKNLPVQRLNNWASAIVLRFLSLTFYYFPKLQRLMKSTLAKYVMKTPTCQIQDKVAITIEFADIIKFNINGPDVKLWSFGFTTHMASANAFEERTFL